MEIAIVAIGIAIIIGIILAFIKTTAIRERAWQEILGFQCPTCKRYFKTRGALGSHRRFRHG
jgi:hypothetical protein